jgi:hypothetical protein
MDVDRPALLGLHSLECTPRGATPLFLRLELKVRRVIIVVVG